MPNTLIQNFQERIIEVLDEYMLLGADPKQVREVLQQEIDSDIEGRARELGADIP